MNRSAIRTGCARFLEDEAGQDMAEYAVLIALVALAVITAVIFLGGSIANTFTNVSSGMNGANIAS